MGTYWGVGLIIDINHYRSQWSQRCTVGSIGYIYIYNHVYIYIYQAS